MEIPAVDVQDLWFSYHEKPVLLDINLLIRQGDFLAILGPNGGGKTTLIKLILGILKPDQGMIRVFGKSPGMIPHLMGYVPQHTHVDSPFPISVMDVVLMGRLAQSGRRWRYSREDRQAAENALARVGILEYQDRSINSLSGGERQRAFIARALVSDSRILFLDEPTASVDAKWHSNLYELLQDLNKTVTVVVVSHDISILSSYVRSVACVNRSLYYHDAAEIPVGILDQMYQCPVEIVAHGQPHRVLHVHKDEEH